MALFRYIGAGLDGLKTEGLKRARNKDDLEGKLAEEGVFLQSCRKGNLDLFQIITGWIKKSEITRLTRQMAVLISSGISIIETVESVREQIDDKTLGSAFDEIRASLESGLPLHQAFGMYPAFFDNLYLSLLETGELSGTLDKSLERIASYRERSESVSKKVKSALTYPALVLLVSVGVIFVLITYIIPIFSSMYANFGLELPTLTLRVVSISHFLKETVWYLIISLMIFALTFATVSQTNKFKYFLGYLILRIPVIKTLALKLATARFCRTLGTLLNSGLQLINAVSVATKTVGNRYIENKLLILPKELSEGSTLATTLSDLKIFPTTVNRMVAAGESTGRLGEMFSKAADFYESEIDTEISSMTAIIEPMIILILGVVIAFILVAMYLPLFDLIGQMGG